MRLKVLLFVPFAVAAALPSHAVDGIGEINQTCAVNTGCFSGDIPGFPVWITSPGSYRLTGNLDVSVAATPENTSAIEIRANGVTLDLNGFTISGPTVCTLGSCTPSGTGMGVQGNGSGNRQETAIRNGVIRGMGDAALVCDRGCSVEGMRLESNGGYGIHLANGPGVIRGNSIRNNALDGIRATGVITDNVVERNGGTGIFGQPGSVVSGNHVNANTGNGLRCANCTAVDNNIQDNTGFGVVIVTRGGLGRNVIVGNSAGTIDTGAGTLLELDANICSTGTTCP